MIPLVIYQRKNPKTALLQYFLKNDKTVPVRLPDFYSRIQEATTISTADLKAVVNALQEQIIYQLKQGYSVRLGDLGSFHVTIHAKGKQTAAECSSKDIKNVRVQFTPSANMRNRLKSGQDIRSYIKES